MAEVIEGFFQTVGLIAFLILLLSLITRGGRG